MFDNQQAKLSLDKCDCDGNVQLSTNLYKKKYYKKTKYPRKIKLKKKLYRLCASTTNTKKTKKRFCALKKKNDKHPVLNIY
ncbi:8959_t:CDS:2 [Gigaspora margarita]|uniref:8959_t:CDS:1 n=1 Tax=Gigaspora margarita TaxID=4874 RepID=A0ABN7UU30_GIGMA|nr:8959_t:CDS:2 [Gigaspora margarita]